MSGCSVCTLPFSAPCDDILAMLVCATRWLSTHLYTLVYMFMHESCLLVCHPCFNTIKLWTSDPNLHLSVADTSFCLPSCFVCLFACLLSRLFMHLSCLISYHMLCLPCLSCLSVLCPFYMFFLSFPSIACLLVSCLCLCMYACGVRMHGTRARSPRCKQKG